MFWRNCLVSWCVLKHSKFFHNSTLGLCPTVWCAGTCSWQQCWWWPSPLLTALAWLLVPLLPFFRGPKSALGHQAYVCNPSTEEAQAGISPMNMGLALAAQWVPTNLSNRVRLCWERETGWGGKRREGKGEKGKEREKGGWFKAQQKFKNKIICD